MEPVTKKEVIPDEAPSSRKAGQPSRGERRDHHQKTPRFQGSCEELKGWVFDSTDSRGADKFDTVKEEIA
eukprot:3163725-Ditylum_brightwellii.AAC.1